MLGLRAIDTCYTCTATGPTIVGTKWERARSAIGCGGPVRRPACSNKCSSTLDLEHAGYFSFGLRLRFI